MDAETSQAFAKVLEYITNSIGKAVDSKGADVTEYIKKMGNEVVEYKLGIAYLWEIVGIIALVVGVIMLIFGIVQCEEVATVIGIVLIIVAAFFIICNAYTIIGCKTFPEKIILDYAKHVYENKTL